MQSILACSVALALTWGYPSIARDGVPLVVLINGTNVPGKVSMGLLGIVRRKLEAKGARVYKVDLRRTPLGFAYGQPTDDFLAIEKRVRGADGVVALVPEYQGSYPGVLKMFLDQLDYPNSPLTDKVATFIGYSGGDAGGRIPVETLSRDFQTQGAHIFSKFTYIARDKDKLDETGNAITDPAIDARLETQLGAFVQFLRVVEKGQEGAPTGELFKAEERQDRLKRAGIDLEAMKQAVTLPRNEKAMVEAQIQFFKEHAWRLNQSDQAALWEELSREIDDKLGYATPHVSRGYRWRHGGVTFLVYQGPLAFTAGKHATLVLSPNGQSWMGLAKPIETIETWDQNLNEMTPL